MLSSSSTNSEIYAFSIVRALVPALTESLMANNWLISEPFMIAKYRRRKPDMHPEHDFFALGLLWKNGRPGGLWVPLEHVQVLIEALPQDHLSLDGDLQAISQRKRRRAGGVLAAQQGEG